MNKQPAIHVLLEIAVFSFWKIDRERLWSIPFSSSYFLRLHKKCTSPQNFSFELSYIGIFLTTNFVGKTKEFSEREKDVLDEYFLKMKTHLDWNLERFLGIFLQYQLQSKWFAKIDSTMDILPEIFQNWGLQPNSKCALSPSLSWETPKLN